MYRNGIITLFLTLAFSVANKTPDALILLSGKQHEDKVLITMKRDGSSCGWSPAHPTDLNACPTYSVSISGDGTVIYEGTMGVKVIGQRTHKIAIEDVKKLTEEIHRIDFFSLKDRYVYKQTERGTINVRSCDWDDHRSHDR